MVGDSRVHRILENTLQTASECGLVDDAVVASNETQVAALWHLRDSISPAERALGPAVQHDISVPVARMAEFVEQVGPEIEERFPGARAVGFGHLGDGNIHFHVLAPPGAERASWESQEGKAITGFVHDRVTEYGGSISAEHGIGQAKRDEFARLGDPVALAILRRVKQALDPQGILNPGKLLQLAPDAPKP
jgi:FAD/FMN-containing dehydrogenase